MIKTVSLAPNLRVEYGNGICLIVGVYDLVDRKSGKPLRYPDPAAVQPDPYEPAPPTEEGFNRTQAQPGLTTEGNGSTVEYDFIGTGFHVGKGLYRHQSPCSSALGRGRYDKADDSPI